ncbi:MAG: hypothetical protein JXJ04_06425 [Spirochaetales bacterium]|nr:hypothetical protein [Spirochaetales bacterium]
MKKKRFIVLTGIFCFVILITGHAAMAQEICGKYDTVSINGGEYTAQNNAWGSDARQCINVNGTGFTVTVSEHNQGSVAAYPSIYKGCHWGECTNNSGLPLQFNQINNLPFTFTVSSNRPSGEYNISAEAWLSARNDSSTGYDGGAEIMIWLDNHGMYPAGSRIGTFNGHDVYYANIGWNFLTYVQTGRNSASGDYKDFINDAISRGYAQSNWYVHVFEAGFELMVNGAGLQVESFSFGVNSGTSNTTAPTNPPNITPDPTSAPTNPPAVTTAPTSVPTTPPQNTPIPAAGVGDVWFVPQESNVGVYTNFATEIHANTGSQRLAAYGFNIIFANSLVSVNTSVGKDGVDEGPDGFIAAVNATASGLLIVSGFDASGSGPGSDLHIVTVNWKTRGNTGSTTLQLTINDLADQNTNDIGIHNAINGYVNVSDVILGDTNSDGAVDIVDALLIAQAYVDLYPGNYNAAAADTNCNGTVDIVDALLIAQYYVGLISQFC